MELAAGDADAVPVLVVAGAVQPDAGRPDDEVHAIDDEVAHRDAGTPGARADAIAPAGVRAVLAAQEQLVRPVAFLEADAVQRVARELRDLQATEHAEEIGRASCRARVCPDV